MRPLIILVVALWGLAAGPRAEAQDLTALARVDPASSAIEDRWFGRTDIVIGLNQGVPFRVFTLDAPARLIVDFREADWSGITPEMLLPEPGRIAAVRFGAFLPGWSRLVVDLAEPMLPTVIGMPTDAASGTARLEITLKTASPEVFAAAAGVPKGAEWATDAARPPPAAASDDRFVVAIDPGHGGVDPGAARDGVEEKDMMLRVAQALAEVLRRTGQAEVVLTRTDDRFVSLPGRVDIAHRAGADLFISLHADALSQGGAQGATVYTLSDEASDEAARQLARQHNRTDILAGVDLTDADDEVAGVLLDLARQETAPRAQTAARALIAAMDAAGGPMNRRPEREAGFSVLTSADIPSILIEVGFLSSERDLANLRDPIWRAVMVEAMAEGILAWYAADAAESALVRQ